MSYTDVRNEFFDKLTLEYEREFAAFSTGLKRTLGEFIQTGPWTKAEVIQFFQESGLVDVVNGFVEKYDDVLEYTARLSNLTGISLVLPERSLIILDLLKENQVQKILDASNSIYNSVTDASLRYGIGESKLSTIYSELSKTIDTAGRRIISEAVTGASMYDRTVKYEQFTAAEVELFYYDGPLDKDTRAVCRATLGNSLQTIGWTREQVEASDTGFFVCGGYNCRHEWLPFVEGLDEEIKQAQKQAGIAQNLPE